MKISLVGPVYPYRGGIAHYTTSLARALARGGHSVHVVSFRRQYPALLYPGKSDKDPSAAASRLDAEYVLDPLYPWTWRQAARLIMENHPHLVLVQWWTTFWSPAFAGLARNLQSGPPLAYLIHNVIPHEAKVWDRGLARMALQHGKAFIVQTPREQSRLRDLIPAASISYCNHPVYERFGPDVVPREIARRQLGLPLDRPVLLFFGIVRPYKGLGCLLSALSQVSATVHLVVAGEFWEEAGIYRRQISDLHLHERVAVFDEYITDEQAHLLFSAADALVAPYIGGTQSGSVERALGYDLPVIVTDKVAAGMADFRHHAVQVVPAGSVPALAEAIRSRTQDLPGRSAPEPAPDDWARMVKVIETIAAGFQNQT